MLIPNFSYLWLAARLKLRPTSTRSPLATFAGVTFAVKSEHYQLRELLKKRAIQPVLAQLLNLCNDDTLFVDVGANIGLFSLLMAAQTGAHVLAIEPVRSTFHDLVCNCSLNPSLPVAPLNFAVGAVPGVVDITAVPGSGINQVVSVAERQGEPRQTALQLRLDQLRLQDFAECFKRIVIKIDVERYEFEVLKGCRELVDLDVPLALCVEVEPRERARLQEALGSLFSCVFPTYSNALAILPGVDLSNIFFVNQPWRVQGLPC